MQSVHTLYIKPRRNDESGAGCAAILFNFVLLILKKIKMKTKSIKTR
jgi:hypothetical protein